jgi:hypothetical protein
MPLVPPSESILKEALTINPNFDINALHEQTFHLMVLHRGKYYERRVKEVLSPLHLPNEIYEKIREKLLEPVDVGGKTYSNFMEEVSRRISQAFQPISGQLAELCARRELEKEGLQVGINFTIREERTDITVYCPEVQKSTLTNMRQEFPQASTNKHRVEVKNVSLRERAARGLAFDGDSLLGFFNQPNEFTESNLQVFENLCNKTGGNCYVPPELLEELPYRPKCFRPNTRFGKDMAAFAANGKIP